MSKTLGIHRVTLLTPGMESTRLFQSFTAVAGTVWIKLPANLQSFLWVQSVLLLLAEERIALCGLSDASST